MLTLSAAGRTEQGLVRKSNDDAYRIYNSGHPVAGAGRGFLYAVADGIGSYRAGGQAAAIAVDQLGLYFQIPGSAFRGEETVDDLIYKANDGITRLRTAQKEYYGMGSTLTALLVVPDTGAAVFYQVGDSMAYVLRRGRFVPITTQQKTEGSELANHLGIGARLAIEKVRLVVQPGDSFLLCSDGVHGYLPEERLAECLGLSDNPAHCLDALMSAAVPVSKDNVTAIVVKAE
jgi:protein phosphatase